MENDPRQTALKQNLDKIYDPSDQFEPLPFYDNDLFKENNGLEIILNLNYYLDLTHLFV
jgi:hypothetical protein